MLTSATFKISEGSEDLMDLKILNVILEGSEDLMDLKISPFISTGHVVWGFQGT